MDTKTFQLVLDSRHDFYLAEHWAAVDRLGMLAQFGFGRVPGQSGG